MAQTNKSIKLTINTETKGLGAIKKLITELDAMGVEVSDVSGEFGSLKKELDSIGRKSGAIERLESVNRIIDSTAQELEQARHEATRLGRELANTATPTKTLSNQFERASTKVRDLKRALNEERVALKGASNAARAAGIDTKRLVAEKVRLSAHSAIATEKVRTLKTGLQKLNNEMRSGGKSAKSMRDGLTSISKQLATLQKLAGAFYIGRGFANSLGDIARVADSYKLLQARIELVSDTQEEYDRAQQETSQIAKDTHTGLEDVINLYTRLRFVQQDQNVTQEDTLKLTRLMTQALKISGASQAESAATLTQLTQAFSSGVLRGEEFNSMMEQGPRLAKALADGLGVPVSALRDMAEAGEITSDKLAAALIGQASKIEDEYRTLPKTVGDALTNINTSWLEYVGQVDDATGASKVAVEALNALANNLDQVVESVTKLAAAGLAVVLGRWVIGLRAAVVEAIAMRTATTGMGAASAAASVQMQKLSKVMKAAGWIGVAVAVKELTENLWDLYSTYDAVNEAQEQQERTQAEIQSKIARYTTEYRRWSDMRIQGEEEVAELSKHQAAEYQKQLQAAVRYWSATSLQLKQQGKDYAAADTEAKRYADALSGLEERSATADAAQEELAKKIREAGSAAGESAEKLDDLSGAISGIEAASARAAAPFLTQIQNAKAVGEVAQITSSAMKELANDTRAQALVSEAAAASAAELESAMRGLDGAQAGAADSTLALTDSLSANYDEMLRASALYRDGAISAAEFNDAMSALADKNAELREQVGATNREVERSADVMSRAGAASEKNNAALVGMTSLTHVVRNRYYEMSDAVGRFFDETMAGVHSIESWWDALSDSRYEQVKAQFEQLVQANDALIDRLRSGAASSEDLRRAQGALAHQSIATAHGFIALGEEQLGPLRAALEDAQQRLEALRDSAESSLASLSDELDRLNGNMAAIEQRNYERRRLELQAKLAEAQAAGDAAAIAALQKSLAILKQIHDIKMANLAADNEAVRLGEKSAKQSGASSSGPAASGDGGLATRGNVSGSFADRKGASRHVLELKTPSGSREVGVNSEADVAALIDALEQSGLVAT